MSKDTPTHGHVRGGYRRRRRVRTEQRIEEHAAFAKIRFNPFLVRGIFHGRAASRGSIDPRRITKLTIKSDRGHSEDEVPEDVCRGGRQNRIRM